MRTYRINLIVPSGFITPWQSDTIFGHLCWTAERHNGFNNFQGASGLINLFRGNEPPFILSDGYPNGLLPSPITLRNLYGQLDQEMLNIERYGLLKRAKKREHLTLAQFQSFQRGYVPDISYEQKSYISTTTLHNCINRLTNTTSDQGSLFERDEMYAIEGSIQIYVKIRDGFEDDLQLLFAKFAQGGYGAKKSAGKGAFAVESIAPFSGFDLVDFEYGNTQAVTGFVTLSHFVPAQTDPTDGAYKIMIKYGKLGEEKTFCGQPFKKPLIMLKPGAVFRTSNVKPFYGRLVEDIAYVDKSIVQYGFAFTVPIVQFS